MTTLLGRTPKHAASVDVEPRRAPGHTRLPAGWPLTVAIAGYPVWWILGLTPLAMPLAALPMAWYLVRRRTVKLPPGFFLWMGFLLSVAVSAVALNVTAPGTLPVSGTTRFIAFAFRFLNYLAITVALLYVGNLAETALPRLKVIRTMSVLCLWTIALGCAGVLFPHFTFRSPVSALLPASLADLGSVTIIDLAQVQKVLGYSAPRPAAPYAYTNAWGNNVSLLLVWFLVGWWVSGRPGRRMVVGIALLIAIVPIVYTLDRGMWIGLILSVLYVALRLAARGKVFAIGAIAITLGLGTSIFIASPLGPLVTERLAHGHSDATRTSLANESVRLAKISPLIGFGTTRRTIGSAQTIAVGATKECPKCGNRDIGSTGQIWLVLVAQGFLGAALYFAYFLRSLWSYRRDRSAIGLAGTLVILLSLFYGLFYNALIMPLAITMLSIALLWRNAMVRSETAGAQHGPATTAP